MGDFLRKAYDEQEKRAVNRGSGVTEFESYDRVAKIERRRV